MIPISSNYSLTDRKKRQFVRMGAKISPGDVSIVDLTNSSEATAVYIEELASNPERAIDPVVHPTFGYFGAVSPQVQQEVFNIISSYEPLRAADFAQGNIPPILLAGILPVAQAWQFHHAQMAIVGVIDRLANPGMSPNTHTIQNLHAAAFICELSIVYANVWFVLHITRRGN